MGDVEDQEGEQASVGRHHGGWSQGVTATVLGLLKQNLDVP